MSRRNAPATLAGHDLHQARRKTGRRSPQAAEASAAYGRDATARIAAQVEQDAARAQQRWDSNGTPWWMRVKAALRPAGRHG